MTHYFDTPTTDQAEFPIQVTLWGQTVELHSAPGVFSSHRLDPGTAVLLRTCPPPTEPGPFLDLGCGFGPIALALGLHTTAPVWAVDVNQRAVDLTAANAQRLGLGDRVLSRRPEEIPPELQFTQIWSNPPIRIGKSALHELLTRWLQRLTPTGQAHLVVAKNLGADSLAGWLQNSGWPCHKVASAKGYRVLAVAARPV